MSWELNNRVKVNQIVESQLPQFIRDDIIAVEESQVSKSGTGTYTRLGNLVTINATNHELVETTRIKITYLTGSAYTGFYSVESVIDANTFTVRDSLSGKTSGTLEYEQYATLIGLETPITTQNNASYAKYIDFLKQYYKSHEFQGGPTDLIDNLDQYLRLDSLLPEVVVGNTTLTTDISSTISEITVESTKGFPNTYGLFQIDDEIITYKAKTETQFLECVRGFSGISSLYDDINQSEMVFSTTDAASHTSGSIVKNLSVLFLQEFYKKVKYSLVPGLENYDFVNELNVGNFIKEARSLYECKGTEESFRILFNVLFGVEPKVIDLEQFLFKTSSSKYIRREVSIAQVISGNPVNLKGQIIYRTGDDDIRASISDIQSIIRNGNKYYKLYLFVGYDESASSITGNFDITPSSKAVENTLVTNSSYEVVTVDSTVGFPESGFFFYDQIKVYYSDKTINQFLNCYVEGSDLLIKKTNNIVTSETYYGYENGDESKKVELRITGVLSGIEFEDQRTDLSDHFIYKEGDEVFVKNLGRIIENPETPQTRKEIVANTWIYNTSCRFQIDIDSLTGSQFNVFSDIDESNLKVTDYIEFLERGTELVVPGLARVRVDSIIGKTITVNTPLGSLLSTEDYDIRRLQNKASSSNPDAPIKYGNDKVLSDVLNVYQDKEEYVYVASNSLPSYPLTTNIYTYSPTVILSSSYNSNTQKYSVLRFNETVSFLTGDRVYYSFSDSPIDFLEEGTYYVEVLANKTDIRLYVSRINIEGSQFVEFGDFLGQIPEGDHSFTAYDQRNKEVSAQKVLRKFDLSPELDKNPEIKTRYGAIGLLKNGVELYSYKTKDKIYYGPIDNVQVLNTGVNYDVINPPLLEFSTGSAKLQPIVTGSIQSIIVKPQEFDIGSSVTATISGGNGSGAQLEPIILPIERELTFDARIIADGGGIDINAETITFNSTHGLVDGQQIFYNKNGNSPIGIGSYQDSNVDTGQYLIDEASYYSKIINDSTIQLFPTFGDYISGINTVGITTINNIGTHIFKTEKVNSLSSILVIDGGSGYTNRYLRINPTGISTEKYTFNYINHGFNDGETVEYTYQTTGITGLSSTSSYKILKISDDVFRLSDVSSDPLAFERRKFARFSDTGSGYQIIKYPEISLDITYSISGIGTTITFGQVDTTTIVRGSITDVYVYEKGSDYGSISLNTKASPSITVKTGNSAQLKPIVSGGQIVDVQVQYGGVNYYSYPDLTITGTGSGAILRPIIGSNYKITDVEIINPGSGYDSNTKIFVTSAGQNAVFQTNVRGLTINNSYKLGEFRTSTPGNFYRKPANDAFVRSLEETLQYVVIGYYQLLMDRYTDDGNQHSPIIGWAYDGNPIYGAYGYSDPDDPDSPIAIMTPGYVENVAGVENRPSGFDNGFFIEDYQYTESGDLDEHNGRFCRTPEFPNGVYAYFSTVSQDIYDSNNFVGRFPYFIGDSFRSNFDQQDNLLLNHLYDFNNSNLIRNTLPYKVNDAFAGNDFIIESNEIDKQKIVVESITSGGLNGFDIITPGDSYKVADRILLEGNTTTGTYPLARVSEIVGKDIIDVSTQKIVYNDVILTWESDGKVRVTIDPYHDLQQNDRIILSGLSTSLAEITGEYRVGIQTNVAYLDKELQNYATTGIVTSIVLENIPVTTSIGSSIKIGDEILSVLNVYKELNALQVLRSDVGVAHTSNSEVYFLPNSFTVDKKIDFFNSSVNDIVFFNPTNSVGVGTTSGLDVAYSYYIDNALIQTVIPTQGIYIPNHPFKTNQRVLFRKPSLSASLQVRNTPDSSIFNIPSTGETEYVYIINQSKNYIGIVTDVALTDTSKGVYFVSSGTDDNLYSFESDYGQEFVDVELYKTTITTASAHGLSENDPVVLQVNAQSGIGTTNTINLRFIESRDFLLTDSISIVNSGINTTKNTINLPEHNLSTGDKIYYDSSDSVAVGLTTSEYFVFKVDENNIKLCETYIDATSPVPTVVGITDIGGTGQTISQISPKVQIIKNNDLIIGVSDSSLSGYDVKLFYNDELTDEFVSIENNTTFNVIRSGTVGSGTTSTITLRYDENLPDVLYYGLVQNGAPVQSYLTNINYPEILFVNSKYSNSYTAYNTYGIGSTTFNISLKSNPEELNYTPENTDVLTYVTKSRTANGPVNKINVITTGSEYKTIPSFSTIQSDNGVGAYVIPKTNNIGTPNQIRIVKNGFDYPSDRTLRPSATTPVIANIKNSNTLTSVNITNGGNNYIVAPDLIIFDNETNQVIDNGVLTANLSGLTIGSVDIVVPPKGLSSTPVSIKAINNTNGISIYQVQSSPSGIVTCFLQTPIIGFSTDPFSTGDLVFIEGIVKDNPTGDGFNSADYNYQFFTITNYYEGSNPGKFEFSLSNLTTNAGIAKTIQDSFATVISADNYPVFEPVQDFSNFFLGEPLLSDLGNGFVERDLIVKENGDTSVRLYGTYVLSPNEIIKGKESFNVATVNEVQTSNGTFEIKAYSSEKLGWADNLGRLSDPTQVLPDNDYYQNLSYTVQSPMTWDEIVSPVNSLLHTSGLKNFSDTQFVTSIDVSRQAGTIITTGGADDGSITFINSIVNEVRVDTINNIDLAMDVDIS